MHSPPTTPGYHIWTIGCQMNQADSRYLAAELEHLGYTPAGRARDATLIVLNTCVVRQHAEDKIYAQLRELRGLKKQCPQAVIAVMGCLVGHRPDPELKNRFPFVDVFMPPSDLTPLLEYLERDVLAADRETALRQAMRSERYALPRSERGRAVTAFVPAVLGCSHACSFCVVPYRRGPERSRPRAEILDEVRALAAQGVREITLLGQIVDRYGLDLGDGSDLAALLEDTSRVDDLLRVRFLTSHPNWLTDRLLDAVASTEKVCSCIEVPFQAGNDEVLERMRRGYTAPAYRRLVEKIRARVPGVAVHADVIVGFPGETPEQFDDTVRLMEDLDFDMVRIARYSERPQTLAARTMPDDIDDGEKARRHGVLEDLLKRTLEEKNRALLGREVEVLVEGRGRKNRWGGRTPQNKPVFFEDERDLHGRLARVRIEWTGPFSLIGRAADRAAALQPETAKA